MQENCKHRMDAIKSRGPCKNSEDGNSMGGAHSSRDSRNITASTAEGRLAATRMPEIVETSQQQYYHQQRRQQHNMDAEIYQKVIRRA
jgi:hypothetical protein